MQIKVIITDDHPLVLSGLCLILRSAPQIRVIATYNNGEALLAGLAHDLPDVLITDLHMPGELYGIELLRTIRRRYPQLPILVLSGQEAIFNVKDIMAMGCSGYLLKDTTDQGMLVQAIEQVYSGSLFLEPSLKDKLVQQVQNKYPAAIPSTPVLTKRQIEIIALIAEGHTNQYIAEKLFLSVRTIESHRQRIMQKLEVNNTASLLKKASDIGLIYR